ncbi:ornithine carbamoyltransferase [Priestia megaterium]|uniref:ornithine carbamoyltransferase n=1 Tax=Priestia megaterium TaxID=1404 RepID=UPI00207AF72D|nr:ornithine carbamoyltransferase [Priestia megaterium]USL45552.1 ornithine carbamoyltransferase [Priestia megaterium]
MKHLLSLKELSKEEITGIIQQGIEMKENKEDFFNSCEKKGLLLLFQKTSTRTNLSFQSAINQLGGYSVDLNWNSSNFSISPIQYEARYVSRNCDLIMARLKKHDNLKELAKYSSVPVINGCCEKYHPTQTLADVMTIYEHKKTFEGVTVTFVGVHNNVVNSLIIAALKLGFKLNLVTPIINNDSWDEELMGEVKQSNLVESFDSIEEIIGDTDFIYTDTWVDMEHFNSKEFSAEKDKRIEKMMKFQINKEVLKDHKTLIMHDMPIHPGYEISEDIVESESSIIYQQAENRMHVEKALINYLLNS